MNDSDKASAAIPSVADHMATMTGPEGHKLIVQPYWRRVLDFALTPGVDGALPFHTIVLGAPKKEGKSTLLSAIGAWAIRHLVEPDAEVYVPSPPTASARPRVYRQIRAAFGCGELETLPNGVHLGTPSPGGCSGEGQPNPSLTLWDDLWRFNGVESRQLWEDLCPAPTVKCPLRVVASYAGYETTSPLLFDLWRRGEALDPVPEFHDLRGAIGEPVVRAGDGMLLYWDTVHRAPWMTGEGGQRYLAAQQEALPPSEFQRLHRNQWIAATEE